MSWWDDLMGSINRPVNFAPQKLDPAKTVSSPFDNRHQISDLYSQNQAQPGGHEGFGAQAQGSDAGANALSALHGGFNQSSGAQPDIMAPASNVDTVPHDDLNMGQQNQQDPMAAMLAAAINNPNPYSSGPYMANLDAARSASLKSIADTRNMTNADFAQSNAAIGGMYAKGKADTLADNQVLKDNNANLVGGLNGMYAGATKGLQADRTQELSDQAKMDAALGIQQAGLGDAGKTQTQAIANASQAQQASVDKALQYGAADLTDNTARADGLISEGTSRQAALRSQLAGVMSQLNSKTDDVNQQYAQNSMQAANQSYQDNLSKMSALYGMQKDQRTFAQNDKKIDSNSRVMAAAIAAQGKNGANGSSGANGSNTNIQDANSFVQSQGLNPADYNNAYSGAILDAGTPAGMQATETDLLKQMMAKNPNLDLTQAIQYIRNASNSSKYNAPSSAANPGGLIQMASAYAGQ